MIESKLRLIGRGRNSEVWGYGQSEREVSVVLKVVSSLHKKEQQHLKNQFNILSSLNHPNIVEVIKYQENVTFDRNDTSSQLRLTNNILVMEHATHGSLLHYIHKQHASIQIKRSIFRQIAEAVRYLHSKAIAHRDIKLQNILVFIEDQQVVAKLSDFGMASYCRKADQTILFTEFKGTRKGYIAPEIHLTKHKQGKPYDALKADIFSLGVVLFAMVFGKLPFEYSRPQNKLYDLIMTKRYDQFWNVHSKSLILGESEGYLLQQFKSLFHRMVSADPCERPQAGEVLLNSWLMGDFQ